MQSRTRSAHLIRIALFALFTSHLALPASAQRPPEQPDAARILHEMQKLNVLGSVLYIAAHPDDENTRLIAWLANGKKVRTGYLSLTRGDGGQNLIGPEQGDALGIIRTQELMEARRIDGGEQFFTRAVDFGFSKNAKESFEKWGHDEVLSDVVRVIRQFRPDIIITRFPPTREAGHGHHEASAILAAEAFKLAGDPKAFPEQLKQGVEVWQPRRLFFNGSTWWKANLADIAKPDSGWYTLDVGGYDPLLGLSYTEIAARSRSMHKSQGFGSAETRGEMIEYLKLIDGDKPKTADIFEGIDMTWGRVPYHEDVPRLLDSLISFFDPLRPVGSFNGLLRILDRYEQSGYPASVRTLVYRRADALRSLLLACAGIVTDVNTRTPTVTCDSKFSASISAVKRSSVDCSLFSIATPLTDKGIQVLNDTLTLNAPLSRDISLMTDPTVDEPYWLRNPHTSLYSVADPAQIGLAVAESELTTVHSFILPGRRRADRRFPITYKWVDRVAGERIRPVYVTPAASIIPKTNVLIARGGPQTVEVEVEALTDSLVGQLNVSAPEGWMMTKELKRVNIAKRNTRQAFTYQLMPTENARAGSVKFEFSGDKGKADRTLHTIDYPHIMPQVYYTPAEVKLVPVDVTTTAKTVGYIKGAGDLVPEALAQLGVTVEMIDPSAGSGKQLTAEDLSRFDAIVTGIRAYNTTQALRSFNATLFTYVENGGTLVVQYNTQSSDMVLPDSLIGPYPFKITRDRVTVEEAPPTFPQPDHALLNTPNKITSADFDGWIQERGLYFCGKLDPHYTPLIAWNDPGEKPLDGGLITCDYGKGRYVYTGISFFRELPAGVPGAYRLFANLISKRVQ